MSDSTAGPCLSRISEQQGRSRRCLSASPTCGGLDGRRPRPAAHDGVLHRRRSPARTAEQRRQEGHRRGGRHAVRGPSDHGHPIRPAVSRGRGQAPRASVFAAAPAARLLQAPASAGRNAGVADGRLWISPGVVESGCCCRSSCGQPEVVHSFFARARARACAREAVGVVGGVVGSNSAGERMPSVECSRVGL